MPACGAANWSLMDFARQLAAMQPRRKQITIPSSLRRRQVYCSTPSQVARDRSLPRPQVCVSAFCDPQSRLPTKAIKGFGTGGIFKVCLRQRPVSAGGRPPDIHSRQSGAPPRILSSRPREVVAGAKTAEVRLGLRPVQFRALKCCRICKSPTLHKVG
jgi:hypothetical protein